MSRFARSIVVLVLGLSMTAVPTTGWASTMATEGPTAVTVAVEGQPAVADPAADPRQVQLQSIYLEAQQRVGQYNATKDTTHLLVARELLARWLVGHKGLYGDSAAALAQRQTIEHQLAFIDSELVRVSTPPPVVPPPVAAPTPVAPPPPTFTDADRRRLVAHQQAQRWMRGGATTLTIGLVATLGVSLPLWASRNSALQRADEAEFRERQQTLRRRARRRQAGAIATLASGAPFVLLGAVMVGVGASKRRRARTMALHPTLAPGYAGASLSLRW